MIITRIIGGLGNQLFQYAIARRMATDTNQPFAIDSADFSTYHRPLLLNRFQISGQTLSDQQSKKYRHLEKPFSLRRFIEAQLPIALRRYRLESPSAYFTFQPNALIPPPSGDVYLRGYWQHEDYFKPIREILLREFTLKPEFEHEAYRQLLSRINAQPSIGIHVRRGDQLMTNGYITSPETYYIHGVDHILLRIHTTPTAFIFSDDIDWAKQHVKLSIPTIFIDHTFSLSDEEAFIALSRCSHQVISNSTFSWWAAWLNTNPDKQIVAPTMWMNGATPAMARGPIPSNWERLD